MFESLLLYFPNFLAAGIASSALALLGLLLSARGEVIQSFVVSQSAVVGLSLAVVFLGVGSNPAIFSFASVVIVYWGMLILTRRYQKKSSELLIVVFLFLIAFNGLLSSFFPALEQRFVSAFLGDLALASTAQCYWLLGLSLSFGAFMLKAFGGVLFNSFWLATSGLRLKSPVLILFYVMAALLIAESTRVFGFLFTSGSLFCVPLALSLKARRVRSLLFLLVFSSLTISFLGFALSLGFSGVSTSSAIASLQAVFCFYFLSTSGLSKNTMSSWH